MAASDRERRHFAVIAATMAEEKAEQRREAASTSVAVRVRSGILLGVAPRTAAIERALDDRADAQIGLARAGRRQRR